MSTRDKLKLLLKEMKAADELGPGGRKATGSSLTSGRTRVFNAQGLANELRPEISLHYSVIGKYSDVTHQLEYLLLREEDTVMPATQAAVHEWLIANPSDMGQEVDSNLKAIRRYAGLLEPEARKRVMRHQVMISKEFKARTDAQ